MFEQYLEKIREKLINEYSNLFSQEPIDIKALEDASRRTLQETLRREHGKLSEEEQERIINDVVKGLTGFGRIDEILKDPHVTEIMINGPQKVYVERFGKTQLSVVKFDNEQQLMALVYKILRDTRRRVDETFPYTEVSLKDGSRVNIIIPPLALNGPTLTIRKFMKEIRSIDDLINLGTLDRRMAEFLVAAIKAKINMVFTGATGAGKTTLLNVLSSYIGNEERIITIEDTAELRLAQEHVVRLESRQPNIEGKGEIDIRALFKNSLRMRPDRIIIGEIRGEEVLEMLQAICSGHKGSLAVLHANSPQDAMYRIETMILTSGIPINLEAINRQIAAAVHLIVQQEQVVDGSRKTTHITQVNGIRNGQVSLEDIFTFKNQGTDAEGKVQGRWVASGVLPAFYHRFAEEGISLPKELFNKDS